MKGYLGEEVINIADTEYKDFTPSDWVMFWLEKYGQIDGAHHKAWVLDQIARILKGTRVIVTLAKWDNGYQEYRFHLDLPSKNYWEWVRYMENGEDGPNTYSYEIGTPP